MNEEIVARLKSILINDLFVELPESEIGLDDGLRTVIGLDSVGFAELRVLCERRFNVQISDADYAPENFSSLRLLAALIERLQKGLAPTNPSPPASDDGTRSEAPTIRPA